MKVTQHLRPATEERFGETVTLFDGNEATILSSGGGYDGSYWEYKAKVQINGEIYELDNRGSHSGHFIPYVMKFEKQGASQKYLSGISASGARPPLSVVKKAIKEGYEKYITNGSKKSYVEAEKAGMKALGENDGIEVIIDGKSMHAKNSQKNVDKYLALMKNCPGTGSQPFMWNSIALYSATPQELASATKMLKRTLAVAKRQASDITVGRVCRQISLNETDVMAIAKLIPFNNKLEDAGFLQNLEIYTDDYSGRITDPERVAKIREKYDSCRREYYKQSPAETLKNTAGNQNEMNNTHQPKSGALQLFGSRRHAPNQTSQQTRIAQM